jgi:hypothetical protein
MEDRPLFQLRLDPDSPTQSFQYFLANGQANPGARELLSPVQTLE